MTKSALVIVGFLMIFSCSDKKSTNAEIIPEKTSIENSDNQKIAGYELMKNNCNACHAVAGSEKEIPAPPMVAVKAHYLQNNISRGQFVADIVAFMEKPTVEKSKMPDAVQRFGLMPYQTYKKEDIQQIAEFIYDYKIAEPEWFAAHYKEKYGKDFVQTGKPIPETAKTQDEILRDYALETKQLLGENLQKKIKEEGTEKAIEFCNIQALPLTNSVATKHHLSIKRVSDKVRNPQNKPSSEELQIIKEYQKQILQGQSLKGKMVGNTFYMPILTNQMCLQCHGTVGKEVKPEINQAIRKLYPNDKATGYQENELRGIFVVKK